MSYIVALNGITRRFPSSTLHPSFIHHPDKRNLYPHIRHAQQERAVMPTLVPIPTAEAAYHAHSVPHQPRLKVHEFINDMNSSRPKTSEYSNKTRDGRAKILSNCKQLLPLVQSGMKRRFNPTTVNPVTIVSWWGETERSSTQRP